MDCPHCEVRQVKRPYQVKRRGRISGNIYRVVIRAISKAEAKELGEKWWNLFSAFKVLSVRPIGRRVHTHNRK
jgi:hypothetical protein